jgi:hypothetical protein
MVYSRALQAALYGVLAPQLADVLPSPVGAAGQPARVKTGCRIAEPALVVGFVRR